MSMKVKILRLSHHKFKSKNLAELFDDLVYKYYIQSVVHFLYIFNLYLGFFCHKNML